MAENTLRFNFLVGKNEVPAAAAKNEHALTSLATKTAGFGKIAAVALGGVAVAAGGLAAAGAVMGVKTAASLEQAQIGFTTLLGSSKAAGDYLAKLKTFAAATPFELPGLIESSRTLMGVGVSAKDAMTILHSFGDAAAAVGISQEHFQNIMVATSQAIGAGRFMTADLNQIMNNGIPIWTVLSKAMGKPIPVLRDMASKGQLLSKDVLPLLEKQMGKDYGGAMAKQSQTLSGLWSTLMDTINIGLADTLQPLLPTLKTLATDGIQFLGAAFSKLPGFITTAMGGIRTAVGWLRDHMPHIDFGQIFGAAKDASARVLTWFRSSIAPSVSVGVAWVSDHMRTIDFGKLFGDAKTIAAKVAAVLLPAAGAILDAAKTWGGRILTGIQIGLSTSNWKPLGTTIGQGLVAALSGAASIGSRVAAAVAGWIGSVDWLAIGKSVGGQAIPFAIGFVNSLVDGLFTAIRQHPMDVALFVLAFIPVGKLLSAFGPLREAITHLPLGSWFMWLIDHTAVPVFDAVRGFLGSLARVFLSGIADVFPFLRGGFGRLWSDISTEIGGRVLYFVEAGRNLIFGFARGMGQMFGLVLRDIGSLIADIVRPFARAGGWLISKGVDLIAGLGRGILSMGRLVFGWIGTVIGWLTFPFRTIIGWLKTPGTNLIQGLGIGLRGMKNTVFGWIGQVVHWLTDRFASISGWLVARGRQLIAGLVGGIRDMLGSVSSWVFRTISSLTQPFRSAGGWLINYGRFLIRGLLGGISSALRGIRSWVSNNIVNPITNAVRDFFGISSPSKVFHDIGGHLIGGLVRGMLHANPTKFIGHIFGGMPKALSAIVGKGLVSFASLPAKAMQALGTVAGFFGAVPGSTTFGKGVSQWSSVVLQALSMLGQPASWLGTVLSRMQRESGGNPRAINLWDINAQRGDPSRGLMQTIGSTFNAYAGSLRGRGIYDPLANVYAGLNYAIHRYGSLAALNRPGGYDAGGIAAGRIGYLWKGTTQPERVLSPRQTASFERLVGALDRTSMSRVAAVAGGGSVQIDVHVHGDARGFEDQLVTAVNTAARNGRLDRPLRQIVNA